MVLSSFSKSISYWSIRCQIPSIHHRSASFCNDSSLRGASVILNTYIYISFIFLHLGPKGGEEGGQISRWARKFLIYPKGRARNCFKFHESLLLAGISHKGLWLVGISYESIRDSVKSWVREFIASRHPCGERYADVDRISATAPSTRREGGSPAKN